MKKHKQIPKFSNDKAEKNFWDTHDTIEYGDWSEPKVIHSREEMIELLRSQGVKMATKTISIRIPIWLLDAIKMEAARNDVPYQSYMKILMAQNIAKIQQKGLSSKKHYKH